MSTFDFGPFQLELETNTLQKDEQQVELQPRPAAVLRYLTERPGQLVTKEELRRAVWTDTVVSPTTLKVCIREVRKALGDKASSPQYIETVGREGYRFIGRVHSSEFNVQSAQLEDMSQRPILVGREEELSFLHTHLEMANQGQRQFVFVTGEAGIGKTALVQTFIDQLDYSTLWVGHGQCVEQYGEGAAYLPILEALTRLDQSPAGESLIPTLRQYAPSWLVQLPGLITEDEYLSLQRQTQGATQTRILRELAEALEAVSTQHTLLLILEDLHWSDVSTLELLSYLAQRPEAARLFILATYRPTGMLASEHPLRGITQELKTKGLCEECTLGLLTQEDIAAHVADRLGGQPSPSLSRWLHERTEGNALFMMNLVSELIAQALVKDTTEGWRLEAHVEAEGPPVPQGLFELVEKQLDRLSPEQQRVLESASVVGVEFAVAALAAGLSTDAGVLEEVCEDLTGQGHFIEEVGIADWPDGTLSGSYRFQHALYQQVLYDRIPEARRVRLHRAIGEREETAYDAQARARALELATHFERGRDLRRAVQYLWQAGENASQRGAYQDATNLATRGIALLSPLPDNAERTQLELKLHLTLCGVSIASKGYAAPEVEQAYARVHNLCQQIGETPELFWVCAGLFGFHLVRANFQQAQAYAERMHKLAKYTQQPLFRIIAHTALGQTAFFQGTFQQARTHLLQAVELYDPQQHNAYTFPSLEDPGVVCFTFAASVLSLLGYPDQGAQYSRDALHLADELQHPYSQALALSWAGSIHKFHHAFATMADESTRLLALSDQHGFYHWLSLGLIWHGWSQVIDSHREEGISQIQQGIATYQATGAVVVSPYQLGLLAEAYKEIGRFEEGLDSITKALAAIAATGERMWEAELYRLKGELTLEANETNDLGAPSHTSKAEQSFHTALEIARQQEAKSLELRAAMSLARLWQNQGKVKEAHQLISETYQWFSEGFGTKDLQEAQVLLAELTA